jgi:hypothetical protein
MGRYVTLYIVKINILTLYQINILTVEPGEDHSSMAHWQWQLAVEPGEGSV